MLVILQASKRYQNDGGTFRVYSDSHKINVYTLHLRQTDTRVAHAGVIEQAGGARNSTTPQRGGAKRAETWRGSVK